MYLILRKYALEKAVETEVRYKDITLINKANFIR